MDLGIGFLSGLGLWCLFLAGCGNLSRSCLSIIFNFRCGCLPSRLGGFDLLPDLHIFETHVALFIHRLLSLLDLNPLFARRWGLSRLQGCDNRCGLVRESDILFGTGRCRIVCVGDHLKDTRWRLSLLLPVALCRILLRLLLRHGLVLIDTAISLNASLLICSAPRWHHVHVLITNESSLSFLSLLLRGRRDLLIITGWLL